MNEEIKKLTMNSGIKFYDVGDEFPEAVIGGVHLANFAELLIYECSKMLDLGDKELQRLLEHFEVEK